MLNVKFMCLLFNKTILWTNTHMLKSATDFQLSMSCSKKLLCPLNIYLHVCDSLIQIMAIIPDHALWKRIRPEHHAGAVRSYQKPAEDDGYPRGPNSSPRKCPDCDTDSQYDSASPDSLTWYVSSGHSSHEEEPQTTTQPVSTFDMKGEFLF